MKGFAKLLAVLLLALAPAALTSVAPTQAQPNGERRGGGERREGRPQARQQVRQAPARQAPPPQAYRPQEGYRAPQGYAGPPPAAYRGYASQPYAAPPQAYAPQPYPQPRVYNAPPAGYGYGPAPPAGYAPAARPPNSLGAGWGQQQDQARRGVRQGQMMPLRQVITGIRGSTPGRLLDAGLEPGPDGRPAYRVRWAAAGGRRIDFIVDAVTGAILARTGY
jgi:hypothetical protein